MSFNKNFKSGSTKYKNGPYTPKNLEKYIGHLPAKYRSGLELQFFQMFDATPKYVKWSAEPEEFRVPYIFDDKKKMYQVDAFIELDNGAKMLVEIKPSDKLANPLKSKWAASKPERAKAMFHVWRQNVAKWKAAKTFAEARGMSFVIMTEMLFRK